MSRRILLAVDDALGGGNAAHVIVDDLVFALTGDADSVSSRATGRTGRMGAQLRLTPMKLRDGYGIGALVTF
jgi:hypothetical protein